MKEQFYEFKNENEVVIWINSYYKKFIDEIQKDYINNNTLGDALFSYTGSMSKSYNIILKSNRGNIENIDLMVDKYYHVNFNNNVDKIEDSLNNVFVKDAKVDIRLIYDAFNMNSLHNNIVLFHYFNMDYFNKEQLKDGLIKMDTFISTTLLEKSESINKLINHNRYNSLLIIKAKKGVPCIPIGNNPKSNLKEYEIILKPKSQFKINNIKKKFFSNINCIIECEMM